MNVLVTGSSGFVAGHLIPRLTAMGHEVLGLAWDPEREEGEKLSFAGAPSRNIDLGAADGLWKLLADFQPAAVYHLAAQSSPHIAIDDPLGTYHANVSATLKLLEALRAGAPGARFLFVSSSEVYGRAPERPLTEDDPLAPCNPYGASKAAAEMIVGAYRRCWDMSTLCVRSFTHAGPGQRPLFALPAFARQIACIEAGLQAPRLRVGNLTARRDYLDVGDVVDAYLLLLEKGVEGETYNLCSGRARSIREALDLMLAMSTAKIEISEDPALMRPVDTPLLVGSADKLKQATGWEPRIAFEETLARTLDYWRRRTNEEEAS